MFWVFKLSSRIHFVQKSFCSSLKQALPKVVMEMKSTHPFNSLLMSLYFMKASCRVGASHCSLGGGVGFRGHALKLQRDSIATPI